MGSVHRMGVSSINVFCESKSMSFLCLSIVIDILFIFNDKDYLPFQGPRKIISCVQGSLPERNGKCRYAFFSCN